jgi:copper homeostasis protein
MAEDLRFEICVDGVAAVLAAEAAGADRVELCAGLFEGGLTPSIGTVRRALARRRRIRIHAIVRPRGGDFLHDEDEIAGMLEDIAAFRQAGVEGVVFGALDPDGRIDRQAAQALKAAAGPLAVTFHRAFDMARDPFEALEDLIALKIDRVLTSGQEESVLEGAPLIRALARRAAGRIVVMPGGGITARNVGRIVAETGARELHFAALATRPSAMAFLNPRPFMGGALRQGEYERQVTHGPDIAAVMAAARAAR